MSVYNAGEQLQVAVASVINQSFADWELLIIDDGSSDGAVERLDYNGDPRVHIICDGDNRGLAARLNEAIGLARGEYLARMDQDDICHPDRFAEQLAALESDRSLDLVGARCLVIDENDAIVGLLPFASEHGDICRRPWRGFYLPHPTWMGRADWFRSHRYRTPGPYFCEDQELLLRTFSSSRFRALPRVLLAYRIRSRVALRKIWRTRVALLGLQWSFFIGRKRYADAIRALLTTAGRLGHDLLGDVLGVNLQLLRGKGGRGTVPVGQIEEWEALIVSLSRSDQRPLPPA